jgi:competence protein ComEA
VTRFDLLTLAAVGGAVVLAAAASLALLLTAVPPASGVAAPSGVVDPFGSAAPTAAAGAGGEMVVDVEGGVASPGIHRLPSGARVADALAAAGGYSETADLAAAAQALNLAAALVDGQQIYVPVVGDATAGTGGGSESGLVNLNRATQSELEALPGIGPVTAGKIIAAREEQPFTTLDELVTRDVLTARQRDQIADLVTVP